MDLQGERLKGSDLVTLIEAVSNEVLLAGAAILFLIGIEARIKRNRAQRVLHELPAIAHVIGVLAVIEMVSPPWSPVAGIWLLTAPVILTVSVDPISADG